LLQPHELLHEGSGALGRVGIEPVSHGRQILAVNHAAEQEKPSEVIEFAVRKKPPRTGVFADHLCYLFAFDFNKLGTDFTADFPGEVQWIQLKIKKYW
jgi:hypothetical protein